MCNKQSRTLKHHVTTPYALLSLLLSHAISQHAVQRKIVRKRERDYWYVVLITLPPSPIYKVNNYLFKFEIPQIIFLRSLFL